MSFISKTQNFYQKHPLFANLMMMALVVIILCLLAMIFMNIWTDHGNIVKVPDVRTMSLKRAEATLAEAGLKYEVYDSAYNNSYEKGAIIETFPRPNTTVKPGRAIYLTINAFSPRKVVIQEELEGQSLRSAKAYLSTLGINPSNIYVEYVPSQFDQLVISVSYNGKPLNKGSVVPIDAIFTLKVGVIQREQPEEESFEEDYLTAPEEFDESLSDQPIP